MTLRMPPEHKPNDHTGTVIGGIVGLVAIIGGVIVAVDLAGSGNAGLLIGVLVAVVPTVITSWLALLRTEQGIGAAVRTKQAVEQTQSAVNEVAHAVNGDLDRRMREMAQVAAQQAAVQARQAVEEELARQQSGA